MEGLMRAFEVRPIVFLAGYIIGAVLAWFAALDWMRKTGRLRQRGRKA